MVLPRVRSLIASGPAYHIATSTPEARPAARAAGLVPNTRLVTSPTEPTIAAARNTVPTMVRPLAMCTSCRLAPRRQTIR